MKRRTLRPFRLLFLEFGSLDLESVVSETKWKRRPGAFGHLHCKAGPKVSFENAVLLFFYFILPRLSMGDLGM